MLGHIGLASREGVFGLVLMSQDEKGGLKKNPTSDQPDPIHTAQGLMSLAALESGEIEPTLPNFKLALLKNKQKSN